MDTLTRWKSREESHKVIHCLASSLSFLLTTFTVVWKPTPYAMRKVETTNLSEMDMNSRPLPPFHPSPLLAKDTQMMFLSPLGPFMVFIVWRGGFVNSANTTVFPSTTTRHFYLDVTRTKTNSQTWTPSEYLETSENQTDTSKSSHLTHDLIRKDNNSLSTTSHQLDQQVTSNILVFTSTWTSTGNHKSQPSPATSTAFGSSSTTTTSLSTNQSCWSTPILSPHLHTEWHLQQFLTVTPEKCIVLLRGTPSSIQPSTTKFRETL